MKKVSLFNREGQKLTEVNINHSKKVDAVQWGKFHYIWDENLEGYREMLITPAIITKAKK